MQTRLIRVIAGRAQPASLEPGVVEACRHGDREAFRVLFEACKHSVYSIALNFSGDKQAAHDITQDVFLKLFRAIRNFRGDASLKTWLFRLVVNACADERRRGRRFVPIEEASARADHSPSHEVQIGQEEMAKQVRSAVATLPQRIRIPLLLRHVEGLSYTEIAQIIHCSVGTVGSRLNRGHKMLAERLAHLRGAL